MQPSDDRPRVLVVEDEALIAMDLEAALLRAGYAVVGPAATVAAGTALAATEPLRAAVLDVNIAGELVFPVADALARRRVPFLFVTGYGPEALPSRFRDRPLLRKPCLHRAVLAALKGLPER
jgi:DNA-binding response OmpR family regulator